MEQTACRAKAMAAGLWPGAADLRLGGQPRPGVAVVAGTYLHGLYWFIFFFLFFLHFGIVRWLYISCTFSL